jgi:hypothetical protein
MFISQGKRCATCQRDTPTKTGWDTDHCHTTGKVRGIICHPCNIAIGLVRENLTTLTNMMIYLAKHVAS